MRRPQRSNGPAYRPASRNHAVRELRRRDESPELFAQAAPPLAGLVQPYCSAPFCGAQACFCEGPPLRPADTWFCRAHPPEGFLPC